MTSAPSSSNSQTASQTDSLAPETNTKVVRYIIKSEGSGICVYCEGEDKPIKTVEMDSIRLAQGGPGSLEKGIRVSSKEDLNRLLEDLCS